MKIRIGTRGSKLAIAQTEIFTDTLRQRFPQTETEITAIKTLGDKVSDKPISKIGASGVFAGAIENALKDGAIDIAVHSAKDLPLNLSEGLQIKCALKRGDPRDVLVTRKGAELKENAVIGTSSIRRKKNIGALFPDAMIKDIRGNVDTRIGKLKKGEYDGIILAAAGLERLGLFSDKGLDFRMFEADKFVCAPCQGIIAVQSRAGELDEILNAVNDADAFYCFETERYVLKLLGGDCSVPAGAYARVSGGKMTLTVTNDSEKTVTGEDDIKNRFKMAERLVNSLWE